MHVRQAFSWGAWLIDYIDLRFIFDYYFRWTLALLIDCQFRLVYNRPSLGLNLSICLYLHAHKCSSILYS